MEMAATTCAKVVTAIVVSTGVIESMQGQANSLTRQQ